MRGRFDYVLSITNTVVGGLGSQGSNPTKNEGSGPEEKFDLAQARGILQRTIRHFSYSLRISHRPTLGLGKISTKFALSF